jgi:hypothetical protein
MLVTDLNGDAAVGEPIPVQKSKAGIVSSVLMGTFGLLERFLISMRNLKYLY